MKKTAKIVAEIANLLKARGQTLAVAESCTGGLIAATLTNFPGISSVFLGGVVTYHNDTKHSMLGISPRVIKSHGAVSESVAYLMAKNARKSFKADFTLSTTGIAGPSGGTSAKPVGTVYIGLSSSKGTQVKKLRLGNRGRETIREQTTLMLLAWLLATLKS